LDQARLNVDAQNVQADAQHGAEQVAATREATASRADMNAQDNQTAMRIAAAEIEMGNKTGISTGTGINP
jgi:hypothetical protein